MDAPHPAYPLFAAPATGLRQHRYMESSDVNAAFQELFRALRVGIRRGLSNDGQLYGLEMDVLIPGEILATDWIPPCSRGLPGPTALHDDARRHGVLRQLVAEQRPEALFAYVCERGAGPQAHLYVEVATEDALYAVEYPILAGRGWRKRELVGAMHRRIALAARA